jgi:ligand-binding sensor domain-containing protein
MRATGRPFGCVTALLADRAGGLWVGGETLDHLGGDAQVSLEPADGLPGNVHALIEARDGTIWVGGVRGVPLCPGAAHARRSGR